MSTLTAPPRASPASVLLLSVLYFVQGEINKKNNIAGTSTYCTQSVISRLDGAQASVSRRCRYLWGGLGVGGL